LNKSKVPENVTVFRGMRPVSGYPTDPKEFVGMHISDKGFVSTSLSPETAKEFLTSGGYVYKIKVKKGTKAAYIEGVGKHYSEQELLLPRGSKFKVTDAKKTGNYVTLDMELSQ